MATMKTRTEYTFDCLLELQRVVCRTLAPKQTLRRRVVNLAWGGCFMLMGVYLTAHDHNAILSLLLLAMGWIVLARYFFFYHLMAWSALRSMKENQRANDFYFESDHILARQKQESAKYYYAKCSQLLESATGFYYIMDDGQGMLLDKENLKGGSVDELRAFLEQKTGKTIQNVKP